MTPDTITADTASNVPGAASPAPEKHTPSRRQRQAVSKELPKSATACFSCDTPILIESVGFAYWELIHKVERGHNVVQTLPSNNIHDLTGATTTPVKNNCSFEQSSTGGIDMIRMGSGGLTPHHHIFTEKGWMTARQAANIGQGEILTNYTHPRIYNLCLEGGGNILINTSRTQGLTTLTIAATMGYRFEPATNPQQQGSLTYPEEVRNQLGRRQDLQFGRKAFGPGEVQTLPNGELIFKNKSGDIPSKTKSGTGPVLPQLPTSSPIYRSTAKLAQLEAPTATSRYLPEGSGKLDQGNLEDPNLA